MPAPRRCMAWRWHAAGRIYDSALGRRGEHPVNKHCSPRRPSAPSPSRPLASPRLALVAYIRTKHARRQLEAMCLQPRSEARSRAGRLQLSKNPALGRLALHLQDEDILQHNDITLHPLNLGDIRDLALAILKTGLLDNQVDRRGDLLANNLEWHIHTGHH